MVSNVQDTSVADQHDQGHKYGLPKSPYNSLIVTRLASRLQNVAV